MLLHTINNKRMCTISSVNVIFRLRQTENSVLGPLISVSLRQQCACSLTNATNKY